MKNRFIDRRRIFTGSLALVLIFVCACLVMASCGGGAGGGAGGASIPAEEYTTHNPGGWGGGGSSGGSGGSGSGGGDVTVQGSTPIVVISYTYNNTTYPDVASLTHAMQAAGATGEFTVPFTVSGESSPRTAIVTKTSEGYSIAHQYKALCSVTYAGSTTQTTKWYYKNSGLNLSDLTASLPTGILAGWICNENGQTYSSTISGIAGDITLSAQFNTFPVTADTYILKASNISNDSDCYTTIHVEGVTGTPTASVPENTPLSIGTFNLVQADPPKYDATVNITGYDSAEYFTDNTIATVIITDPNTLQEATVSFTLKNKYNVGISYNGSTHTISSPFDQGAELTFDNAKDAVPDNIPNDREVVAFKYNENIVLYKTAGAGRPTSIAVSGANFTGLTGRTVWLVAVLDFEMTISGGHAVNTPAPAGTESDPYILNRWGTTDERQVHPSITSNIGTITTTAPADAAGKLRIAQSIPLQPVISVDDSLDDADIPAAGLKYKITVTDDGTGAYKEFWVKIVKPPVLPDFTVQIAPPDNYITSMSDTSNNPPTYALANLTTPFTFTPVAAGGFPDGTTFDWTIHITGTHYTYTDYTQTLSTATGVLTVSPADLGILANKVETTSIDAGQITASCTVHNNNAAVTSKDSTGTPSVCVFMPPTLPDFSIDILGSSDVQGTDTSNPDCPIYSLLGVSSNFTFTATRTDGSAIPANTSFNWSIQANGSPAGDLQRTGTTFNLSPANLALALDSIGTSTSDAKLITIQCTASNPTYAAPKVFSKTMKVYKYTLPDGTATVTTTTAVESPSGSGKYRVNSTNNTFTFGLSEESSLPDAGNGAGQASYSWSASVNNGTFANLNISTKSCYKTLTAMGISGINSISNDSNSPTEVKIKCHVEYSGLQKDYLTTIYLWTRPAMTLSCNNSEISKPSTLLASLGITQDSDGTAVLPATAQLTVGGSTNYTFETSPSGKINVSGTGVVSIADGYTPPRTGETLTITATDQDDSTYSASTTITIISQYVCALYVDKATCEANGTPGWTKILSGSSSVPVSPYTAYGANFESSHGGTISGWKKEGGSPLTNQNPSITVSVQDTKIYAGWAPQVSPSSITLYRFSGNDTNLSAQVTRADGTNYYVTPNAGFTYDGSNPATITVDETKDFGTTNGVYTGSKVYVYVPGEQESFVEIPITVKDCIYVDGSGTLKKNSGIPTITIPENYTIPTSIGGRTVTEVGSYVFEENNTIKTLIIPDGMKIGEYSFYKCTELTTLTIGNNVEFTGDRSFWECSKLETISVGTGVIFGASFIFEDTAVKNFTFPNGISEVPRGIFEGCTQLNQITIPSGVTKIRYRAFYGATFGTLVIPTSVTEIEYFAFIGATGTINYAGTINDWKAVTRGQAQGGVSNSNNVTVHCTNGDCPYWEGISL